MELCKGCTSPRQCRHYLSCGKRTALTNRLDRALARNDDDEVAEIDAKLRKLDE